MEPREQFTFYRSYFDSTKELPQKDRAAFILAVCEYGLYGTEPTGLSPTAKACFALTRPTLDSGRRKAANGKQGGKKSEANSKQTESKPQAKQKQTASEKEGEKEVEKENECYIMAQTVVCLPLNDGTEFRVTEDMVSEFSTLYPAVDVEQELRSMRGWLLSNPKNRKTPSGIRRFMNSWLSREQDKPRTQQKAAPAYTHGADRLAQMIARGDFDD